MTDSAVRGFEDKNSLHAQRFGNAFHVCNCGSVIEYAIKMIKIAALFDGLQVLLES